MAVYIGRRLLLLIPVLLGVTLITFTLTRILPGNPIDQMVSPMASQEVRAQVAKANGLNEPMPVQYVQYIRNLVHGDLGDSFVTSQPVLKDLSQRFPATLELTGYAMLVALVLAIPLGIAAGVWRNTWIDHISRLIAIAGVAVPIFWGGLLLIYFFFYRLHWLPAPNGRISPLIPPPRHITGLYTFDALMTGNWPALRSAAAALIMPVAVLAFAVMASIARMTRASMIDALDADYTRAARALGLSERSVVLRHALRNAILPVLTYIAIVYGYLLGGSVLIENIFAWPGLGLYVFNAITSSDYPAVQGFILYATTLYVLLFLFVDILYVILDPRVKY